MSQPQLLITICARGGSKGVPGKNIKPINGIPLMGYTLNAAQRFAQTTGADITLSTDSLSIKEIAADFGVKTDYLRPDELAGDTVGKVAAIRHVMAYEEKSRNIRYDYVLDLDVTSPLRTQDDLAKAYQMIQSRTGALILFSVNPAHRNPYFSMVEEAGNEMVKLCKRPETPFLSRQEAPEVYDLNGSFYFYRRTFFEEGHTSVTLDGRATVYVMPHMCFDVDQPMDFLYLQYLIEQGHWTFDVPYLP